MAVKYVGKTINVRLRVKSHRSWQGKFRLGRWLRCLKQVGLRPEFHIVEEVEGDGWAERERYWIMYYKEQGADLCNLSNGGEGLVGRKLDQEVVERLRKMFTGRPIPPEQRAQISASLTGKKQSPETIAKRIATIRSNPNSRCFIKGNGRKFQPSYVNRKEGHPEKFSPEWRAKIAATLRARFASLPPDEQELIREQGRKAKRP